MIGSRLAVALCLVVLLNPAHRLLSQNLEGEDARAQRYSVGQSMDVSSWLRSSHIPWTVETGVAVIPPAELERIYDQVDAIPDGVKRQEARSVVNRVISPDGEVDLELLASVVQEYYEQAISIVPPVSSEAHSPEGDPKSPSAAASEAKGSFRWMTNEPVGDVEVVDVLLDDVIAGHLGKAHPVAHKVIGVGINIALLPVP